ncbi:MAG: hypothetical protein F4X82_00785 [Candidatus Spechtbacteria bacterium SB0662_bin_43]|uniref:FAD/NAD(P)-binding domain-containing protein n=1 Tax=Candidatus Spechtbacteria bacterium SB0662_bin_43 TaxID=2604897 RepID=A0A845D8J4_9BACT|nr:hypothetical protein [Candidatus Spechtbacteria bacterium SB0662_bin_43]
MNNKNTDYHLIIIGGGPAGCAAAVYAARKKIRSAIIADDWGGQSVVSNDVQNWIGETHISGIDIAKNLQAHIREYADDVLDIVEDTKVVSLRHDGEVFAVETNTNNRMTTRAVLVCSGARRRVLDVEGAERLNHKGISYCASCDAPLFKGLDVVVVGGGNAGFESALQLLEYAPNVYLFERGSQFRADSITIDKALQHPNMKAFTDVSLKKIEGEHKVEGVVYSQNQGGDTSLPVGGVFVEIGSLPNSEFMPENITLNERNEIVVDPKTQRTNVSGVWAAGDVSDGLFRQNNISMGDAVKALEDIYLWLHKN